MRTIGAVLAAFVILVGPGISSGWSSSSFDVAPWLLRSNLLALQFTRELADRNPEIGSMLGYTDFDTLAIALHDDLEKEDEAFFSKWLKTTREFLKAEKHPELRRDLRLLERVFQSQVESIQLDRKYGAIPLYKSSRLILTNLRSLENPMGASDRLKAAPVRFHGYVAGSDGAKPLTEAYESRIRFLVKKYKKLGPSYPSTAEMETYLKESPSDVAEIRTLLEKSKATDWQSDFEKFKIQIEKFNTFIKTDLLPHGRTNERFPPEVYRWALRSKSIEMPTDQLIKLGREKYAENKKQLTALAAKVGEELALKDRSFLSVLQELKSKQVTQGEVVEKKYREASALLTSAIQKRGLVTLPESPLDLRLATPEESVAEPYPHLAHPPLAFSMGEKAYIALPVAPSGKFVSDDFTFEAAIPALLAHEARPGHEVYFQTLMNNGISVIRARYGYSIPSVEGWAFYAEDLVMADLPLATQLTVLQMRAWTFARMFLDPQVHLGKVSPEEGRRILIEEIGLSKPVAENEIHRYLSDDPGQGPGYGYGYLKILEVKEKTRKRLGKRFSERCFNDGVIALGLLPLDWLEEELKTLTCPEPAPAFGDTASL